MATKRKGLGKGLSALIDEDLEDKILEQHNNGVLKVNIDEVEPNKGQPRKNFDKESLNELSESIKQFGIIQPLIVLKKDDYYEIIAGERRWRAAKIAGLKEVPVIVKNLELQEVLEVSLIENIQRENLNPIEEALAYQKLLNDFNLKQEDIALKVSKSRSAIANSMRLLKLNKTVQQMIIDQKISSGHARALIKIKDPEIQLMLANKIYEEKLSVRDIEKLVNNIDKQTKVKKAKEPINDNLNPIYKEIENNLKQIIGTKVSIHRKTQKSGFIEIQYYSNDELERIIELLKSVN